MIGLKSQASNIIAAAGSIQNKPWNFLISSIGQCSRANRKSCDKKSRSNAANLIMTASAADWETLRGGKLIAPLATDKVAISAIWHMKE
jgi:hypothetical protein